jgi:hypothetical protein
MCYYNIVNKLRKLVTTMAHETHMAFLKNYVTLECVNSHTELFKIGKHYPITNNGDWFVDITDEYNETVTVFKLDGNKVRFIPGHSKIDGKPFNSFTPSHYQGTVQPIDLINAQDLNFNLSNVVKYVCRAGKKDGESKEKDLKKALDYINFELERVTK